MSYSNNCLKCGETIGGCEKYCEPCQVKFRLPYLPDFQKTHSPELGQTWKAWADAEVAIDMASRQGGIIATIGVSSAERRMQKDISEILHEALVAPHADQNPSLARTSQSPIKVARRGYVAFDDAQKAYLMGMTEPERLQWMALSLKQRRKFWGEYCALKRLQKMKGLGGAERIECPCCHKEKIREAICENCGTGGETLQIVYDKFFHITLGGKDEK